MVFICSQYTLEELKNKNIEELDWFLFDRGISTKNLNKCKSIFGGRDYLSDYLGRITFYNVYYTEPLHCYLMRDADFNKLDLLSDNYKNSFAIWNMKRVPSYVGAKEHYARVPVAQRRFGVEYEDIMKYLRQKFEELISPNLNECISHVIL